MTEQMKFSVVCSLFTWMQRSKSSAKKRSKFRKFLDTFCNPRDYFTAIRLVLPNLDRERGTYGLKESILATCLIDALGMSRDSQDALRLLNWRKGGAQTGANAGNFSLVAAEVLQCRQGMASGGLTIKDVNDLLDRLSSSENRAEKTSVLSTLINKTNALEMKWIIMIILKDLKLGISEKSVFHEFHPDAEDLFNVTCDLKLVCEKLRDRTQRHNRQDIEIGKAVRPQLAMRVTDATAAWKKLHGKEVVVECKFDGDRIQIHKNGTEIHFFSRNFLDHCEYGHGMSDIIIQNVLVDRCILDGEMLVWDTSLNRFAEFGLNQEIAKAVKDGLDSDRQLCYVAFDILYVGDTSVIHQSLKERHELLQKVVKPLKGRLEILVPNGGLDLNTHCLSGEPCWSLIAHNVDDVERFFKETIENRDEGIVLKDLGSKWEPSDRTGKWLKLKPEYIRAGSDLDVLIIGGYYGSGRRGGEVAQFLVGIAELPAPNTYPRRFLSFSRVGTGLSDDELDAVVTKLKPYFRKYEYPRKQPPSFYQVTNNSKERPDVWIDSPEKSIILSITSDIRTIRSEVFAAPYSLRFPRIDRVRYDKPWHECLDVQSFVELVHSSNGTTQRGMDYGGLQESKPKRMKTSKKRNVSIVPSHLSQTDVSDIKGGSSIFLNMMFYFVNVPPTHSLDSFHKMVAENGGTFSMNLNNSVTHCVAADSKGIKYQAAKRHGDIINYSWILDCCSQKKLLHLQPKHFLFLSNSSKKLQEEIDEFSDSYYQDLDLADIKQLLSNMNRYEDAKTVDCYKKKYCPKEKWSRLHGCCVYLHPPVPSLKPDWEVLMGLALKRLKLEVSTAGGKVSDSLVLATHLVVLSVPGFELDFETVLNSFTSSEKRLLMNKRLHVVKSQWLEDCMERDKRLQEETYCLKTIEVEDSSTVEWYILGQWMLTNLSLMRMMSLIVVVFRILLLTGALLLEEVVNAYGREGIDAIMNGAKQHFRESQQEKVSGSTVWWRTREATLFALASLSEQLVDLEVSGPSRVAVGKLVEQIITEDIGIGVHEYPFLYARIFTSVAKFSPLISHGVLEHILYAAIKAIGMDVPPPVKVGACRALSQLLPDANKELIQSQMMGLFSSLTDLLNQASDETLHLVLETLQAAIKAGSETSTSVEPIISPIILNVWALHISDPFISIDALEVLEAIKNSPGCIHPLTSRVLPYIGPILNKPQQQPDGLVAGSLDLVTMLLKNAPIDVVKAVHDVCFDAVIWIVLQSDDHSEMQNATECLAAFVSGGREEVLTWSGDSGFTMRSLLDAASRLLDPKLESSGSLFVGSYILQLILNLPSQMSLHIRDLVAALVRRMQSVQIVGLKSSLLLIFARLVHMSSPNVEQFIDLLTSIPAEGYDNSFSYVMSEWTKQQGEIQGAYQIKVTTSALALLLSTRHAELTKTNVQGHLVKFAAGITTRSKAKLAPDQWTMVSLPAKILALLADALIEIREQDLADDDEDSDWEEVQAGDAEMDQDLLHSLSATSSGRPTYEHLEAMEKVFNKDHEDDYEADQLCVADPLNQINLARYLRDFLMNFCQSNRPLFENLCQSLTESEQDAIQMVLNH